MKRIAVVLIVIAAVWSIYSCCFQVVRIGPGREPLLPRMRTATPTPTDAALMFFEVCNV